MSTKKEECIEVLYNNCYGGFGLSEKAIDIYNTRMTHINSHHKPVDNVYYLPRHDPILLEIYHELGKEFSHEEYSNITTVNIPKKYEKCYSISEYDGLEKVVIDENEYKVNTIKTILMNEHLSSFEKLNEIDHLIN